MAATFISLESSKAVRVAIKLEKQAGSGATPDFGKIAEEELFSILDVEVPLRPEDMPGKPMRRSQCEHCGASVLDGEVLGKPCFEQNNY